MLCHYLCTRGQVTIWKSTKIRSRVQFKSKEANHSQVGQLLPQTWADTKPISWMGKNAGSTIWRQNSDRSKMGVNCPFFEKLWLEDASARCWISWTRGLRTRKDFVWGEIMRKNITFIDTHQKYLNCRFKFQISRELITFNLNKITPKYGGLAVKPYDPEAVGSIPAVICTGFSVIASTMTELDGGNRQRYDT